MTKEFVDIGKSTLTTLSTNLHQTRGFFIRKGVEKILDDISLTENDTPVARSLGKILLTKNIGGRKMNDFLIAIFGLGIGQSESLGNTLQNFSQGIYQSGEGFSEFLETFKKEGVEESLWTSMSNRISQMSFLFGEAAVIPHRLYTIGSIFANSIV